MGLSGAPEWVAVNGYGVIDRQSIMSNLFKLPTFSDDGDLLVVVETPRGSQAKLDYDPKLKTFTLSKSLLTGLSYPYDWGFIPATTAEDGDPIDVMVIHDAATYPGLVLTCKIIGVLQVEQQTRVQEEPPPGSDQSVVCVASRGPLDQAAGMMLAQILRKHGLKAEMVKHQAVSRSQIDQLHCADAAVICICYIDAGDATSQLRYLIRRLRQRVPTAQVLVAIWPSDHPVRVQKERQESLGADYYVSSVRAAVDICLESSTAFKKRASVISN